MRLRVCCLLTTITLYTLQQLALPPYPSYLPRISSHKQNLHSIRRRLTSRYVSKYRIALRNCSAVQLFFLSKPGGLPSRLSPFILFPPLYRLFLNPSISLNLSLLRAVFISRNRFDVFCSTILIYKRNCL
jgi:hypothetical protein